jgi:tetratricopeptide (TPR) repeat protein
MHRHREAPRRNRAALGLSLTLALSIGCDKPDTSPSAEPPVPAPSTTNMTAPTGTTEVPKSEPPAKTTAREWPRALVDEAIAAGDDPTKLKAVLQKVDAELGAGASAEGHYLRGRILDLLQRPTDAIAALEAALALEPKHVGAHHDLGLLLAQTGRHDEALDHWSAAAKGDPPHPNSAYNAGQRLYDLQRYEEALQMWRITAKIEPDDFDAAKKIVQALNALGRHAEADRAKADVERIFAASKDPAVQAQRNVVIDQLVVDGRRVMIHQWLGEAEGLYSHWTAFVFGADGKRPEFSVQLESSEYGRETGWPYLSGITRADSHGTWGTGYKALPEYGTWRAAAVDKIEEEI